MKYILILFGLLIAAGVVADHKQQAAANIKATATDAPPVTATAPVDDTDDWARMDRHGYDRYLHFAVGANYLETPFTQQPAIDKGR